MTKTCDKCGAECRPEGLAAGYGVTQDGRLMCYGCCADEIRQLMRQTGRATLYFAPCERKPGSWAVGHVTDWPGRLRFPVGRVKQSRHNLGRTRYDFWFAFDGYLWHGFQIGDNQIAHCRRTKEKAS